MKKALSLGLALVMCLGLSLPAFALGDFPYSDVSEDASYAEALRELYDMEIMQGSGGTFKPNDTITRQEFTVVVCNLLGEADSAKAIKTCSFDDVKDGYWATGYITRAVQLGIVSGMGNNKFAPTNPVTVEQAAKMLVCAWGYEDQAVAAGGWPNGYMSVARDMGLLDGISYSKGSEPAKRYMVGMMAYQTMTAPTKEAAEDDAAKKAAEEEAARKAAEEEAARKAAEEEAAKKAAEEEAARKAAEEEAARKAAEEEAARKAAEEAAIGEAAEETLKAQPVSGKNYTFTNKASGKLLDVYGQDNTSSSKANVQVYARTGTNKSQRFTVTLTKGGWYSIVPLSNTKMAVNPFSDMPKNGTNVNIYTKDTADKTQGWYFEAAGNGYYIIRNAYNKNIVLTAEGKDNKSNVKVATYSGNDYQLWKLEEDAPSTTSTAKIALKVPSYLQTDSKWKNTVYDKKDPNATIGTYGCLLTCTSMVYSYTTGTTTYPDQMMNKLSFNGNGELSWPSFTKLGYTNTEAYKIGITQAIMQKIHTQLSAGKPVIIGGRASGGNTHWVVVTGYTGTSTDSFDTSSFTINDPSLGYKTLAQFLAKFPTVLSLAY